MITDDEVKKIQDIVGPRWVETEPCVMDTYSFYSSIDPDTQEIELYTPRPVAVVMPKTTEEVQDIVKFCNESGLMTKAISTGLGPWAAASRDRVIILDLKRMNSIIEIDVENQIAVIEPYVRAIDLQTELFKHGLNCHVISAGGNHSILASVVAAWGYGLTGPSMGYSSRNFLGAEWVSPTGEILTMGSAGNNNEAGWFTADGPGPSMRGILRGFQGTMGALGVFTKCAVKLYRWEGPREVKVRGRTPRYTLTEIPPRMSMNALAFPSEQAMKDAGYLLGEAEIEYAQFRTPMFFVALGTTDENEEAKEVLESGLFQKVANYVLINAVIGYSDREYKWKMKAMQEILNETGGVLMPSKAKPDPKQIARAGRLMKNIKDPLAILRRFPQLQTLINRLPINKRGELHMFSMSYMMLIRNAINTQGCFRPSQGMSSTFGSFDTWDQGVEQGKWIAEKKRKIVERKEGLILDDGGDLACGGTYENGHMGYQEGIVLYNRTIHDSIMAMFELVFEACNASIEESLGGVPLHGFGVTMNSQFGPNCYNYDKWLKEIKKTLDPNTSSDPYHYIEP